jgi:hypothetical protein
MTGNIEGERGVGSQGQNHRPRDLRVTRSMGTCVICGKRERVVGWSICRACLKRRQKPRKEKCTACGRFVPKYGGHDCPVDYVYKYRLPPGVREAGVR